MEYEFDNIVKEQIEFYYQNENNICDFTEYDEQSYKNHTENVRIFRYAHEIISNDSIKDIIVSYIDKLRDSDKQSYLSTATLNHDKHEFHPLVNLHTHWHDYLMRPDISWGVLNGVPAFSMNRFDYTKKLEFNKSIKSILSVRKQTHFRDYLFSKITQDENCIFRYANYINDARNEQDVDRININQFPTWNELLDEYDKSIISFVVETEKDIERTVNCQISEKTILPFLSGNIVILLGRYNNIKALNDIGLYTWNDYFGFTSDESDNHYDRTDDYIKIYNKIKKLSFEECKQLWLDNQDKIQKNYDIVSNLVTKKWK